MQLETLIVQHKAEIHKLWARLSTLENELSRIYMGFVDKNALLESIVDRLLSLDIDPVKKRELKHSIEDLYENILIEEKIGIPLNCSNLKFLSTLSIKHQNLTMPELKACLFIKLDYSNDYIAEHFKISTRGMESFRKRIHDKLEIRKTYSIKSYLQSLMD